MSSKLHQISQSPLRNPKLLENATKFPPRFPGEPTISKRKNVALHYGPSQNPDVKRRPSPGSPAKDVVRDAGKDANKQYYLAKRSANSPLSKTTDIKTNPVITIENKAYERPQDAP